MATPSKKRKTGKRKRLPIEQAAAQAAAAVEAGIPKEPAADGPKLGRPTKYEERFAQEMLDWANSFKPGQSYVNKAGDHKWTFTDYPFFEEFAAKIGVTTETLFAWATETKDDGKTLLRPEFSYSYARVLDIQVLIGGKQAMSGAMAPGIAALFVKNHTRLNWKEKVETVNEVKHEFPGEKELDAIYAERRAATAALNAKVGVDVRQALERQPHTEEQSE